MRASIVISQLSDQHRIALGTPSSGADAIYDGLDPVTVSATNVDDDAITLDDFEDGWRAEYRSRRRSGAAKICYLEQSLLV